MSKCDELAKEIVKGREPEGRKTDLMFGSVTTIRPLTIRIDSTGYIINSNLYDVSLSQMVRDLFIEVDVPIISTQTSWINGVQVVTGVTTTQQTQRIQVFRSLMAGDRVKVLRYGRGQKFYILERG